MFLLDMGKIVRIVGLVTPLNSNGGRGLSTNVELETDGSCSTDAPVDDRFRSS